MKMPFKPNLTPLHTTIDRVLRRKKGYKPLKIKRDTRPLIAWSLLLLVVFTVLSHLPVPQAEAQVLGDGVLVYAASGNVTPQIRRYTGTSNSFDSPTNTVSGTQAAMTQVRSSPFKNELIMGYQDTAGNLKVLCYNGTSWFTEWTVAVAASGTPTTRRFDIAYETSTGDVTVAYSRNTAATNALAYRTKPGTSLCGSVNWSAATNFPTTTSVTTGIVQWVKAARNGLSASTLDTFAWSDGNQDLGAAVWSGSAFTDFRVLDASIGRITTTAGVQDVDNFDLAYETLSGDLMIVWGNSAGTATVNGAFYSMCTGNSSSCTWLTSTAIPSLANGAISLDLSSDPTSDKMAFSSIYHAGNNSGDLQAAYWSGSAWSGYNDIDATTENLTAGLRVTQTGWLTNGGTTKWFLTYDDSTGTGLSWFLTAPGTALTTSAGLQTDFTTTPALNDVRERYQVDQNPSDTSKAMLTLSDSTKAIYAKQISMNSSGVATWTDADGGASLGTLQSVPQEGFSFVYIRAKVTYTQTAYRLFNNLDSTNVGTPLAAANTAGILPSSNAAFRLRMLNKASGGYLDAGGESFKLQVAAKGAFGSCAAVTSGNYSNLGKGWTQSSSSTGMGNHNMFGFIAFNNKLWLLEHGSGDIWSSTDGGTWTHETGTGAWTDRAGLSLEVFNNKMWLMGGENAGYKNDVWSSPDGVTWSQETSAATWSARAYQTSTVFNNKLWIMGGLDAGGDRQDVWSSSDGVTWQQATSTGLGHTRAYFSSAVFNNKMWVTGRGSSDVYSSSDGVTWTQETANGGWSARDNPGLEVFGGKLWLVGGNGETDVWSSSDGATWAQETTAGGWTARSGFQVTTFNNKIWLSSGYDGVDKDDVWSYGDTPITYNDNPTAVDTAIVTANANDPTDGAAPIVLENYRESAPFANDANAIAAGSEGKWDFALKDNGAPQQTTYCLRMVKADGTLLENYTNYPEITTAWPAYNQTAYRVYDNANSTDVGSPLAGLNLPATLSSTGSPFRIRMLNKVINGDLFQSGQTFALQYAPKAAFASCAVVPSGNYASVPTSNWSQATSSASWSGRQQGGTLVYNNKLWVLAGDDGGYPTDVWSSTDGITWNQVTSITFWAPRINFATAVFNGEMWVIGGMDQNGNKLNDAWSSSDGGSWSQHTAGWSGRIGHAALVFNNKLWVLGGNDTAQRNDVWSSTDGVNWNQVTANAGWGPRVNFAAMVFNNRMWVMGGNGTTTGNDVWSSTDGVNWNQETSAAGWSPRDSMTSAVINNRMWVMGGGFGANLYNDVWASSDGVNWQQQASGGWSGRRFPRAEVMGNKLWVMAGIAGINYKHDVWSLDLSTPIAYKDNSVPTSGSTLTANANDPTDGGSTILGQTYVEGNNFTNSVSAVPAGQEGKWDFALNDNVASSATSYCFRIAKSDGSALDTYTTYPEVTSVSPAPPDLPTTLAQMKTTNAPLAVGDWSNSQDIKFSVLATDPDATDTLSLCIEIKAIGVAFTGTEDSCATGSPYSGSSITLTHTLLNKTSDTEYHWQARVKDAAGHYSGWVTYGGNADPSARDIGIDISAPSGGQVYDGIVANTDAIYNDGSLVGLGANWSGITSTVSGLLKYEYSIGTSPGATDTKAWTNAATSTGVSVANGLILQTSKKYYVNVRTTDNAGNVSTVISSDGQMVSPSLTFSVTPATLDFGALNPSNSYTSNRTTTLTTSTNAQGGYLVRSFIATPLTAPGGATIGNFTGGNYAFPDIWQTGETGYGYSSSDTSIGGANKFNINPCPGGTSQAAQLCYATFASSGPGDIVAEVPLAAQGTALVGNTVFIFNRITASATQTAKKYTSSTVYTVTPIY